MAIDVKSAELSPETVPLGTGLPTREELLVHYPADFTWHQMKIFVNSGYVDSLSHDEYEVFSTIDLCLAIWGY